MATPTWQAARNGFPGDSNAVDKSAQVNQFLGMHGLTPIYRGNQIVTPSGTGEGTTDPASFWGLHTDQFMYDQPFTMSGTNLGRIVIPALPVGLGADLQVSLCNDSSGTPGSVIASSYLPKDWINAFAAYKALGSPSSTSVVNIEATNSPLAQAQYNTLMCGAWSETTWSSPAVGSSGGASNPNMTQSGNYLITVGGTNSGTGNPVNSVFTVSYPGSGDELGNTIPQPVYPLTVSGVAVIATTDTLVVAGGQTTSAGSFTNAVYVAPWDSLTGVVGAWSQQANLPVSLRSAFAASSGENVYVVGGTSDGTTPLSSVYWTTVVNGQITTWNSGPPLPVALDNTAALVIGSYLIVYTGVLTGGTVNGTAYYAPILSDGSLGSWQSVLIPMPVALGTAFNPFVNQVGFIQVGGYTSSSFTTTTATIQTLTVDANGPSANGLTTWNQQTFPFGATTSNVTGFQSGTAQWQLFLIFGTEYISTAVYAMPYISIPLVASGLTNGGTYHILIQQKGGTSSDYVRSHYDFHSLPGNPTFLYRPRSGGSWNNLFTGYSIPIAMFDQTVGGPVLHSWEDGGLKTSTIVHASTPDFRVIGLAECTQFADGSVTSTVSEMTYAATWPLGTGIPTGITQIS